MKTNDFICLQLKIRHFSQIPPELDVSETNRIIGTQLAVQTHPEPTLDKIVALKYEELRNLESLDISMLK